jgi:hypothetical protein
VWQKKKEKGKSKCPNNKKEIYNDKYKHTRDRLLGLKFLVHRYKYSIKKLQAILNNFYSALNAFYHTYLT